jgi:hypothetical protein
MNAPLITQFAGQRLVPRRTTDGTGLQANTHLALRVGEPFILPETEASLHVLVVANELAADDEVVFTVRAVAELVDRDPSIVLPARERTNDGITGLRFFTRFIGAALAVTAVRAGEDTGLRTLRLTSPLPSKAMLELDFSRVSGSRTSRLTWSASIHTSAHPCACPHTPPSADGSHEAA